ncbi:MAG: creatininase family protein, partial [candidate division Zixibacteria bacterium]|nr:creatininase family protein [candidate division Zixibacteria bacterium]
ALSPIEEHGPHLPVGVDFFNASFFARRAAENLTKERPDLSVLLYPTLPIGANVFRFVGSVWIKIATLKRMLLEIARSLSRFGFDKIALFSAHGGPFHLLTLEEACFLARKKYGVKMILPGSAATVKFLRGEYLPEIESALGRKLDDEEKKAFRHDFHAGWWETSMMLLNYPQLVKPEYKKLEPVLVRFRDLRTDAIPKLGKGEGYMGSPARATEEFADATTRIFFRLGQSVLLKLADGQKTDDETESILTKIVRWKFWLIRSAKILVVILALFFLLRSTVW